MAYPDDKEEFRRVVNQDLPDVEGDIVDKDDQNKPADFLERLQDTIGLNIKGGEASLNSRINLIESALNIIPGVEILLVKDFDDHTIILGIPQDFEIILSNDKENSIYLFLFLGCIHSSSDLEGGINCRFYRIGAFLTRTARFFATGVNKYFAAVHTLFYLPAIENNITYKLNLTAVTKTMKIPQAGFYVIRLLK